VRVWLVEGTYSDDEQNLIVLTCATPDGRREFRKERALPSFTGPGRETTAALEGSPDDPAPVAPEDRERHGPDDAI